MKKFIQRALAKFAKLTKEQMGEILRDAAADNDRMEVVLDSLINGVMAVDRENAVILVNKAAERYLPFVAGEYLGRPVWDAIADRDISAFIRKTLESEEKADGREFVLEKDILRIISISILPLVRKGRIEGNVIHVEDVTERKNEEVLYRRAENLASLTTLAAGVAHEIKNPLGSIGIHIQLIQKMIAAGCEADHGDIPKHLGIVNEEVERLNRIVIDFLFAVRPMDVLLIDGDLNKIMMDLCQFIRPELDEAGILLETDLDRDLPLIKLDEKYIKQAFLNLMKNAVSAMPDGGRFRIATRRRGDEVELTLADTGDGIPEENLEKIFEPYFTTKEFGSGLGLTLVFKIMKEHDGSVAVKSRLGEGTSFTLQFPVPQREKRMIAYEGDAVHEIQDSSR